MSDYYMLDDDHNLIPTDDTVTWGEWFQHNDNRIVAKTNVADGIVVSTVCLGINHNWGDGPPILFETMIFRDGAGEDCERCSTWAEAEAQHARVVAEVQP